MLIRRTSVGPQHNRRGSIATWVASFILTRRQWFLLLLCASGGGDLDLQPAVLNAQTGEEVVGNDVEGVLAFKRPWPSLARTVYGDHKRYLDVYLNPYKVR